MDGKLETAIKIFTDQYPKKPFLNQLVSSQLDLDRLDYLKRDSAFTGVYEGSVGIERILKTMRVHKGNVVIEKKGIYAIENYILARRLMYMQVYLHKTVLSADKLMRNIFKRVRVLIDRGAGLPSHSPSLNYFLTNRPSAKKRFPGRYCIIMCSSTTTMCFKALNTGSKPMMLFLPICANVFNPGLSSEPLS